MSNPAPSGSKPEPKPKRDPIDVIDSSPVPAPELFFKVYESEADEPEAKIRRDVNKLYEKWMKEHGRRWPDRGMNTEDLVWLAEEAYKPPGTSAAEAARPPIRDRGFVPVEKEEYEGEFITEPGEDGVTAGGKRKAAKPRVSNYEATKAGGVWVTDEFESDEYIAGNLENMWNTYLWDRDGNPTIMPEGPPDEAAGEESEDWDDFHTAYRPRGINSDDMREAVWATDEFESDEVSHAGAMSPMQRNVRGCAGVMGCLCRHVSSCHLVDACIHTLGVSIAHHLQDNTESEWEPEYVGAGLGLDQEDPVNPQYSLRHSAHPLAPFPGEPLKWASYAYDDGTT